MNIRHLLKTLALGAALVAAPQLVLAQAWPSKPIRLVVPFAAGGPADIQARWIGNKLSATLGQPVVIDNRGGAGGMLGAQAVVAAPADGYTLLFASVGAISISPYLVEKPAYNPKDLAPVVRVATAASVLVTGTNSRYKTFADLVTYAKANPGKTSFASAGPGTTLHLGGEMLAREAGLQMVHVPYKGASPAITDVIGGQVDVLFADAPVVLPFIKGDKLRALAIGAPARLTSLPEVQTTTEAGYKGIQVYTWYGLLASNKVPADIVARINTVFNDLLKTPDAKAFFADQSMQINGGTAAEFGTFIDAETQKWTSIAKAANVKLD
jgi:tripartite-type tricarboxylate transporter receptor subunit TctC